jgi:hypothetical protein
MKKLIAACNVLLFISVLLLGSANSCASLVPFQGFTPIIGGKPARAFENVQNRTDANLLKEI